MLVIRGVSELSSWKSVAFASSDSKPHARSCPVAWNKFRSLWAVTSFHGSWSWRWMESSMVLVWTVDKGPHDDSSPVCCQNCWINMVRGAKRRWAVTSGCWGLGRLGLKKAVSFLTCDEINSADLFLLFSCLDYVILIYDF